MRSGTNQSIPAPLSRLLDQSSDTKSRVRDLRSEARGGKAANRKRGKEVDVGGELRKW